MAARLCAPCTVCCRGMGDFFLPDDRPSPIFSTFACVINAIVLIWAAVALGNSGSCDSRPLTWVALGLASSVVNIAFAIYLYTRFSIKVRHEGSSAGEAACHLFMYDWGVCLYILFAVWLVVWMVFAGEASADADDNDECGDALVALIILFIVYMALGACLLGLSVCTECCRTPKWKREQEAYPQYNPGHARYDANAHHAYRGQAHPAPASAPYGEQQPTGHVDDRAHHGGIRGKAMGVVNMISDKVDNVVSGKKGKAGQAAPAQHGMHSPPPQQQPAYQQQPYYDPSRDARPSPGSTNPPAQNPSYRYA